MSTGLRLRNFLYREVIIRGLLFAYFVYLEFRQPFVRIIQTEDWYKYKFPSKSMDDDLLPTHRLFTLVVLCPIAVITIRYLRCYRKSQLGETARLDFVAGFLSASLGILLNGVITNLIKNQVGRPRPDFFYRCFPDGIPPDGQPSVFALQCTNPDYADVEEGRKSFPSGHSSFTWAFTTWIALYLAAKLRVCSSDSSRLAKTEHLLVVLMFPLSATLIAIGRTCDYKHHWQDVLAGSLLGLGSALVGYRQFFPPIWDKRAAVSFIEQRAGNDDPESKIYDLGNISIDDGRRLRTNA